MIKSINRGALIFNIELKRIDVLILNITFYVHCVMAELTLYNTFITCYIRLH